MEFKSAGKCVLNRSTRSLSGAALYQMILILRRGRFEENRNNPAGGEMLKQKIMISQPMAGLNEETIAEAVISF